jgi:transcriptional regulator with XRE-family HTH domain
MSNVLIEFGKNLRKLREKQRLSQEELGFRAGIDRTYISGVERGLRNISLNNIHRLAKALEIPLDKLMKLEK